MYRAALALLTAVAVSACSTAAPPATSPTSETGVVGGRLHFPSGSPLSQMTVHVVGTQVSAEVGSFGEFVLSNVPAGPLDLHVGGGGYAAGVSAGQIAGGETVTLTVRVEGNALRIDSIARARGEEASLEGIVEAPGTTLPADTIIVSGRSVLLPPGLAATVRPGMRVRVTGTPGATALVARDLAIL